LKFTGYSVFDFIPALHLVKKPDTKSDLRSQSNPYPKRTWLFVTDGYQQVYPSNALAQTLLVVR